MNQSEVREYLQLEWADLQEEYRELRKTKLRFGKGVQQLGLAQVITRHAPYYNNYSREERINLPYGAHIITVTTNPKVIEADVNKLLDTLRHEAAHILDFVENGLRRKGSRLGHGPTWQAFAVQLGAKPQARHSLRVTGKLQLCCATTGRTVRNVHRMTERIQEHIRYHNGCPKARSRSYCRCCRKPTNIKYS